MHSVWHMFTQNEASMHKYFNMFKGIPKAEKKKID